jgi:carbon monoxide dehydrogenase subunit G
MMELTGQERIAAPRAQVWQALNDPEILKACIPGCESIELLSPTEMKARITLKLGPIKASFSGQVTLSNVDPPNSYTISGEGSGGSAGGARGSADVRLTEDGDGSLLTYRVTSQVTGKLAQLGARLVDSAAQKLAGDFFAAFNNSFQQQTVAAGVQPLSAAPALPARDDLDKQRATSWRWFLGLAAGTSALLVLIWLTSR